MDTHAKLNLSAGAIKAAAKTLETFKDADLRRRATESLCAGLRQDILEPFVVIDMSGTPVPVPNPVTWVSGSSGCGKTEHAFAWLKIAANFGRRTLFVGPESGLIGRWHPEDIVVIDAVQDPDWQSALIRGLTASSAAHIALVLPFNQHGHDRNVTISEAALSSLRTHAPAGLRIALDEMDWKALAPVWPGTAASRPDLRFVCMAQYAPDITPLIRLEDAHIQMRSISRHDLRDTPDLTSLREGQAVMRTDQGMRRYDTLYIADEKPSRALYEPARMAIDRMTSALAAHAPSTHTERLETVSRACGFRSWHAAAGRK